MTKTTDPKENPKADPRQDEAPLETGEDSTAGLGDAAVTNETRKMVTKGRKERDEAERQAVEEGRVVELTEVLVKLRRDENTTVATRVYEHELVILRMVYGEESVIETDESETVKVADFTAEGEMERLRRKYRPFNKQGPDVVGQAFANQPALLAQAAGVEYKPRRKGSDKGPAQSSAVDNRKKGGVRGA